MIQFWVIRSHMRELNSFRGQNPHYHCLCKHGRRVRPFFLMDGVGTAEVRMACAGDLSGWPNCRDGKRQVVGIGTAGLSVPFLGVRRTPVYRWKPGIWLTATSSSLSGVSRSSGVGPTNGLFTIVLGGRAGQRTGDGGGHQSTTGCRCHVVESTNIVTVCYGNDGLGPRSIVVSESGGRCLGAGTTRSSGGIVYVGDGIVAPSEQSKCSWTITSLLMPLLYELQILFSGGPAPSGGNVLIAWTCAFSTLLTLIRTW